MTPGRGGRRTIRYARSADLLALVALERAAFASPWSETLLRQELEAANGHRVADAPGPHGAFVLVAEGPCSSAGLPEISPDLPPAVPADARPEGSTEAPAADSTGLEQGEPGPRLLGYAAFRTVLDESELLRVAVAPASRRSGLGRTLVESGLREAARRGAARCLLEVRSDNAAAIALYRSLGFAACGERAGYYPDGRDALLMARGLEPPPREP